VASRQQRYSLIIHRNSGKSAALPPLKQLNFQTLRWLWEMTGLFGAKKRRVAEGSVAEPTQADGIAGKNAIFSMI
jgi:hypothetical protein